MKRKSKIWIATMVGLLGGLIASPLFAVEIITRDDIVNNVVTKDQLVKVADNAVLLLDTSSSSNDEFGDTGQPIIQAMRLVVLPLSAFPRPVTFKPLATVLDLLSHMLLFGFPIAWAASKAIARRQGLVLELKPGPAGD